MSEHARPGDGVPAGLDLDMSAAWMRRAQADLHAFLESFATRMEAALPDRVSVERRKDGFFARTSHVERCEIRMDGASYALARRGAGVAATVSRHVRGVTISSKELSLPEWIGRLDEEMKAVASTAGGVSQVLNSFLAS